jgi:hypothetical protein
MQLTHLFRETPEGLLLMLFLGTLTLTGCAFLVDRTRRPYWISAAFLFACSGIGLFRIGVALQDSRPLELFLLIGHSLIPLIGLLLLKERGWRIAGVLAPPPICVGWLLINGLIVPEVACAQHRSEHAEVHQQWEREYRALLTLEAMRSRRLQQSRFPAEVDKDVELYLRDDGVEWTYLAVPLGCSNCRSFSLDSHDRLFSWRGISPNTAGVRVHQNEVEQIRAVLDAGCYILRDYLCR